MMTAMIRVELPYHLQNLARVGPEVLLEVSVPVTVDAVLDSMETRYPMLCGTIRDHVTKKRRPFLRYFACQQDLSHDSTDLPLPAAIAAGTETLIIWGALAGG
jgi:molybdopterin synthase sulfur carrier subunit